MKKIATVILMTLFSYGTAFAGGGGSGFTQCYVHDLGLQYSFSGYTQSLRVGSTMTVLTSNPTDHLFGKYEIVHIDTAKEVGFIELQHIATPTPNVSTDTNFGDMKIEYFSNSALKDLKVTFTLNGEAKSGSANCITD